MDCLVFDAVVTLGILIFDWNQGALESPASVASSYGLYSLHGGVCKGRGIPSNLIFQCNKYLLFDLDLFGTQVLLAYRLLVPPCLPYKICLYQTMCSYSHLSNKSEK